MNEPTLKIEGPVNQPSILPMAGMQPNPSVIKIDTAELIKPEHGLSAAPIVQVEIFKLLHEDDPTLHQPCPMFDFSNPVVDPNKFASSLVETCKTHKGYGLAAPQCGFLHRVFVMGQGDEFVAFFNPQITWKSEKDAHMLEGCLSFPFLGLRITRPESIAVKYYDFNGKEHEVRFDGLSARIFLHELDHLNGVVYTLMAKKLALEYGFKKRKKLMKKIGLKVK